jgi:MYXO-CTERM domain-containing protein
VPGAGLECTDPGFEEIGGEGECELGTTMCVAGMIICTGYQGPRPETCNGLDEDCDGDVDEGAECPGPGEVCYMGGCIFPCEPGEFPCPFGFDCKDLTDVDPPGRYCVESPCRDVECPAGEFCDPDTGACVDPCTTVECLPGQTCQGGLCFDCFDPGFGCAAGERCVANGDGVGECEPDPCADVECESGEYCREGECVALTCEPECAEGQRCVEGECVADMCAGVDCPAGQICNPANGNCITDVCEDSECPPGQACHPGTGGCIPDPCFGVNCPPGFDCEVTFEGEATCSEEVIPPDEGYDIYASGGGGCACSGSVAGDRGGPLGQGLLLLLGVVLLRRRRRA